MNEKMRKLLGVLFGVAALCFAFGTVNHLLNTGEGVLSSILLALGSGFLAAACFLRKR